MGIKKSLENPIKSDRRKLSELSIFISDIHLGSKFCNSKDLYEFLKTKSPNFLYIIGDLIDGWKWKARWYWSIYNWYVLAEFIRMQAQGTKVIYLTGNHDEFLRKIKRKHKRFHGIDIKDEVIHKTVDGRRILIIHGDKFDKITNNYKTRWISNLGDFLYDICCWGSSKIDILLEKLKFKQLSLSYIFKKKVKEFLVTLHKFEDKLSKYAIEKGCNGVICGHIHIPALVTLPNNIIYGNCGSWIKGEVSSAIIEYVDGKLELWIGK